MNEANPQPKKRGGKRPGAGRKATGHKAMFLNLKPETEAKIRALAAEKQITMSAVVDQKFND